MATTQSTEPASVVTEPINHRMLEFKESFLMVDKTDTGFIPRSEVGKIVRTLGYNPSEAEISKINVTSDPEGNETIDYETFLAFVEGKSNEVHPDDELREAFRVFDRDDNGYICAEEIRRMMVTSGERLTEEQVDEMMKMADKESTGKVYYDGHYEIFLLIPNSKFKMVPTSTSFLVTSLKLFKELRLPLALNLLSTMMLKKVLLP